MYIFHTVQSSPNRYVNPVIESQSVKHRDTNQWIPDFLIISLSYDSIEGGGIKGTIYPLDKCFDTQEEAIKYAHEPGCAIIYLSASVFVMLFL